MKRFFQICLFFLFFLFFFSSFVLASAEFETSYQVRYKVGSDGTAHVSQDISLTNKLSNIYATQYSLNFQSTTIENIQARDKEGPLEIETQQTESSTLLTLKFNDQVVGKDKTFTFSLSYDASDLVNRTGQVWEITVPRLSNASEIDQYQLQLIVPFNFGTLAYISPQPISVAQENDYYVYHFTKNQIAKAGVKAAFGEFQVFDFILDYHLKNDRIVSVTTEIALPPDTAYQKVYYQSLEPKPDSVRVDEDGNWLALYTLSKNERLNVEAIGKVKTFSQSQKYFPQTNQSVLDKNLQEQEFWPVNHPLIQETAGKLKTARDVHRFVVDYLEYDLSRIEQEIERLGALKALEEPEKAICMEFTDLFISLARAIGIPAREANGYSYTTNPELRPLSLVADILHSWPEYWDDEKKIWVPIDPTWEKTTGGVNYFDKFDLNHFVFAIHGVDSQVPAPAGSYRVEENGSKNVQVSFGLFEDLPKDKLEVEFAIPKIILSGIKMKGKIIVHNLGPSAVYDLATQVSGENLTIQAKPNQENSILPPYGSQEIPVEIMSEDWLKIGQGKINLVLDGQTHTKSVKIHSLIWQGILPALGILILLVVLGYFLYKLTAGRRNAKSEL